MKTGQILDKRYQIAAPLGEGGTSRVFLAKRLEDGAPCAVKALRCIAERERALARKEAELLSTLRHPAIPKLLDTLEGEEHVLLVMEYIPGLSLSQLLSQRGPQPQRLVMDWALRLCEVLEYLHSQIPPILYGDLKPGNLVWAEEQDRLVLVDFGSARTLSGSGGGGGCTRRYAAPEQMEQEKTPDLRSDLYGLGTTLFRLLTGAFSDVDGEQVERIGALFPQISEEFLRIIARCVRRDPGERYHSAAGLRTALLELRALWGEEDTERGTFAVPPLPFPDPDEDTQTGEPDTERSQTQGAAQFRILESIVLIHTDERIV